VDYAYAVKTLPQPDDPAAIDPAAVPPPELQPPQMDDARPWAGDLYDEGDESDPAHAYASFSGPSGEQAWLDKAEDGTLTAWVRDETGQVWRYSDPDAWAIDVDDADMQQTGGTQGAPPSGEQDPAAGDPAASGGVHRCAGNSTGMLTRALSRRVGTDRCRLGALIPRRGTNRAISRTPS
jgi:hypothetical protein